METYVCESVQISEKKCHQKAFIKIHCAVFFFYEVCQQNEIIIIIILLIYFRLILKDL